MAMKPPSGPHSQIQKISARTTMNGFSVMVRPITTGVTNCCSITLID